MIVQMTLLEDVIFGNGESIPGEEDISILRDDFGFPYYKGSSFKGIFREELGRLLEWKNVENAEAIIKKLLGEAGSDDSNSNAQICFSDFVISDKVKSSVLAETKDTKEIIDAFSSIRTFTSIDESGMVKEGSLRSARCVNKGIHLYSEISCNDEDKELIKEVFSLIKWLGTMRNRGFGRVLIEEYKEVDE